jgi:hypothetical protein
MKTDYIENMPAGTELDTLIAEKVMGEDKPTYTHDHDDVMQIIYSDKKAWACLPEYDNGDICEWRPKPFSSSILLAWEVVEKIKEKGRLYLIVSDDIGYKAEILLSNPVPMAIAQCDSAPLAICRVALLAIEYESE